MNHFIKIIAMTTSILLGCSKEQPRPSTEVLINLTNECRAKIKVYDTANIRKLSDVYDCFYVTQLPIHLQPGQYKIVAENFQMKKVTKTFIKSNYSQELNIEF